MTAGGMRMDVDPKLQTNRVSDLGRTVRPSTRYAVAAVAAALAVLAVFALICSMAGHGFDILALFYILSRQWGFSHGQWVLAGLLIVSAMMLGGPFRWLLVRKVAPRVAGGAHRTRVDVYAPAMGHGDAVAKVTRARAETMAPRLVRDYDAKAMEPGYPLGRNIVDGTPMSTSWEDMAIVVAGPRSGKSLCYAIPAVCSAPGPCLATSNKGDILDVTRPVRMHDHPDGRIWVFDPERIAEPNRTRTTWVWNLIDSIRTIADAKRIADCWRYASGQPSTGGDDFFPGTAAQQLADYLFAAHLGGRTVADVFRWASSERNTEPVTILSQHEGYGEIASRVSSVIALTPETRSGVFGSLQTMVAFLADPDVIEWILPREGDGTPEGRAVFDPLAFAASEGDTLYLLSAQGRPSTALTASLTAVVAFTAFHYAQSECVDNDRRLPRPMCCVLDEAANICRWPELVVLRVGGHPDHDDLAEPRPGQGRVRGDELRQPVQQREHPRLPGWHQGREMARRDQQPRRPEGDRARQPQRGRAGPAQREQQHPEGEHPGRVRSGRMARRPRACARLAMPRPDRPDHAVDRAARLGRSCRQGRPSGPTDTGHVTWDSKRSSKG